MPLSKHLIAFKLSTDIKLSFILITEHHPQSNGGFIDGALSLDTFEFIDDYLARDTTSFRVSVYIKFLAINYH